MEQLLTLVGNFGFPIVVSNNLMFAQYQAQMNMATQSPMEIALKARELFQRACSS